jgi:arginase
VKWGADFDRLLVHVDADVLSYVDFPIAENVRRCEGLTLDELACAAAEKHEREVQYFKRH